jgi:hypothetical protein
VYRHLTGGSQNQNHNPDAVGVGPAHFIFSEQTASFFFFRTKGTVTRYVQEKNLKFKNYF